MISQLYLKSNDAAGLVELCSLSCALHALNLWVRSLLFLHGALFVRIWRASMSIDLWICAIPRFLSSPYQIRYGSVGNSLLCVPDTSSNSCWAMTGPAHGYWCCHIAFRYFRFAIRPSYDRLARCSKWSTDSGSFKSCGSCHTKDSHLHRYLYFYRVFSTDILS